MPVYATLNYERNHREEKGAHTSARPTITHPAVIPRIKPELFRERKALGIFYRSVAFCNHSGDFGLADCCRCRRPEPVSSAHGELTRRPRFSAKSLSRFARHFLRNRRRDGIACGAFAVAPINGPARLRLTHLFYVAEETTAGEEKRRRNCKQKQNHVHSNNSDPEAK
jgi:hypothetical protein